MIRGWRIEIKSKGYSDVVDILFGSEDETYIVGNITKYFGIIRRTGLAELRAYHFPSGAQVTCDFLGFIDGAKRIDFRYFPKEEESDKAQRPGGIDRIGPITGHPTKKENIVQMFGDILKQFEPMIRPTLERLDKSSATIETIPAGQEKIIAQIQESEANIIKVIGECTEKILANLPRS